MYIAPIEFDQLRHWFLNVDKKYEFLCLFLEGNGECNQIISEAILENRFLIDRMVGELICFVFCISSHIDGDIENFNRWNVRNIQREKNPVTDNSYPSQSLQSAYLREDVCNFYGILRSSLPGLVLISKKDEISVYPIQDYEDLSNLLVPFGIINDYWLDRLSIKRRYDEIEEKIETAPKNKKRINDLKSGVECVEIKARRAESLINDILRICQNEGFDEGTLRKMCCNPEKIRQIVSTKKTENEILAEKVSLLKDCCAQYRMVQSNRVNDLKKELARLQENAMATGAFDKIEEWKRDLKEKEEELSKAKSNCINNLKKLGMQINVETLLDQCIRKDSSAWLFDLVYAMQHRIPLNSQSEKGEVLKCFIAGAKSLEMERDAIISGINDSNIKYLYTGRRIECYTFKNFDKSLVEGGHQKMYNDFIRNQADIVIFVLNEVVGGITKEEFTIAMDTLRSRNYESPVILVFSNKEYDETNKNGAVQEIRAQVNALHQYWIDYSSLDNLKLQIQLELSTLYTKKNQ